MQKYPQLTAKTDQGTFERMFTYLLDRLTDQKVSIRTQRLYLKFFEVNQLEGTYLTSFLFKQHSFLNKNHVRSAVHLTQRLKIIEALLLDKQRITNPQAQGGGFDQYVGKMKKFTKENFPYDFIYPAVIMCSNANIAE